MLYAMLHIDSGRVAYINTLHIHYAANGRVHIHWEDTVFRKQAIINFSTLQFHALLKECAYLRTVLAGNTLRVVWFRPYTRIKVLQGMI